MSLSITRRRISLSSWKNKYFFTFSISVGQCCVSLENFCPPRHEPLHQQKKKNSFPLILEEATLFFFFYVCRTVWFSIRKSLPAQTRTSSSWDEEEFFSFLLGKRNNFYFLYFCRTVWCLIRKPLPTQTQSSASREEKLFPFLLGRRNIILHFLCL